MACIAVGKHAACRIKHSVEDGDKLLCVGVCQNTTVDGAENTVVRYRSEPHVKRLSIHAAPKEVDVRVGQYGKTTSKEVVALYPDVAVERSLCLTDHYLFDVIHAQSDRERVYHWNHHPHGMPQYEDPKRWKASSDLDGGKLFTNMAAIQKKHKKSLEEGKFDLSDVKKCVMGRHDWRLHVSRGEGKPGVVIHMLGGQETAVYTGKPGEIGATTTIAERRAKETAFVVVHEPTMDETHLEEVELVEENDAGVAVRIQGDKKVAVDDRVLLGYYSEKASEPLTLKDKDESFTFRGFTHVRVLEKDVVVTGDLVSMELEVGRKVKQVVLNGKTIPAEVKRGVLTFKAK